MTSSPANAVNFTFEMQVCGDIKASAFAACTEPSPVNRISADGKTCDKFGDMGLARFSPNPFKDGAFLSMCVAFVRVGARVRSVALPWRSGAPRSAHSWALRPPCTAVCAMLAHAHALALARARRVCHPACTHPTVTVRASHDPLPALLCVCDRWGGDDVDHIHKYQSRIYVSALQTADCAHSVTVCVRAYMMCEVSVQCMRGLGDSHPMPPVCRIRLPACAPRARPVSMRPHCAGAAPLL